MNPFLTARWLHLAMLNYEVDRSLIASLVPPGTQLEEFQGRVLVSIVAFRFLDTRIRGLAIPFHRHFTEVNVRFYVRRQLGTTWRRGVVFIRELVPRAAIAWTARALYNEPYRIARMRQRITLNERGAGQLFYAWRFGGRWHGVTVETPPGRWTPESGSEAEFITNVSWGYTRQRDGNCLEYRVDHTAWPVCGASISGLDIDAALLYGPRFAEALSRPPRSAFVADGSPVVVYRGVRIGR